MGAVLDVRRQTANWCRRYSFAGDGAVVPRRPHGALSLVETLRDRFPDELGLGDRLWSRRTVATLVEHSYGIPLSPTAATRYLRAWGLTPREPIDRACALCAEAVVRWQATVYPSIARTAQSDLYWAGRTRLHGVTPATDVVSSVSTRGWIRFMLTTEAGLPHEFLTRLTHPSGRTVHVVVDGSWATIDWPRRVPAGVVLHPLPSCERGR